MFFKQCEHSFLTEVFPKEIVIYYNLELFTPLQSYYSYIHKGWDCHGRIVVDFIKT